MCGHPWPGGWQPAPPGYRALAAVCGLIGILAVAGGLMAALVNCSQSRYLANDSQIVLSWLIVLGGLLMLVVSVLVYAAGRVVAYFG